MAYLGFGKHWWRAQTDVSGSVSLNACNKWTIIKLFVFPHTAKSTIVF